MLQIGDTPASAPIAVDGGPALEVSWHAVTDVGHRRALNEDSILAAPPVFAVADGMGGHDAGDVASAAVVARLGELASAGLTDIEALNQALAQATRDIEEAGARSPGGRGSGTTVTGAALVVEGGTPYLAVFNIGDSRVYAAEGEDFARVTVDHSVVQAMVDAGLLDPADAEGHPDSNVITRAVGFEETPIPDYWLIPLRPGIRLLLCSDGLTKELGDDWLRRNLTAGYSPESTAQALLAAALDAGGRDNVSVIVLDVRES